MKIASGHMEESLIGLRVVQGGMNNLGKQRVEIFTPQLASNRICDST